MTAPVVMIGGSSGAIDMLVELLPTLRPPCAASFVIIVHQLATQSSLLLEVLAPNCALPMFEVLDKAPVVPGTVYLAPPDYHVLVERDRTFALSRDPAVHFSRPSIDVTFESGAYALGPDLVGILLTGANSDGARGLAAIAAGGGRIAVQDPATAHAPEMPRAALAICTPDLVSDVATIASWLHSLLLSAEDA